MSFSAEQRERLAPLWKPMLAPPCLTETRDGTISDETFGRWMRQDYLFVEAGVHFLGALLARAPERHRQPLATAINGLLDELRLFDEQARRVGVDFAGTRPAFVTHAYVQFLTASAHAASYSEAYTVLYAAERAYYESWGVVRDGIAPDSKWLPFVQNWAGEAFGEYVSYLEGELDRLASAAGAEERTGMADNFELTTRYEIAFWEMAINGESWPGIAEET